MARYIGKTQDNKEIFAYDFKDIEVKALSELEIEMVGSTESLDRDGEVLKIDGWDLKNYKKNPVVLPAHMYWEPAIGKSRVSIQDNKLVFKIEFPEDGVYPLADVYRRLYKGGFMKASSVGFIGKEWQWGEKENDPRRTFTKQELLEISLVSIPSNPTALLAEKAIEQAVAKGKLTGKDVDALKSFAAKYAEVQKPKFFCIGGASERGSHEEEKTEEADKQLQQQGDPIPMRDEIKAIAREVIVEEIEKIKTQEHYFSKLIEGQEADASTVSTVSVEDLEKTIKQAFKI